MSIVFNGKTIAGAPPQSDTANAAKKADLTSVIATGATNATGATITSGTFFYLNGTLVQALADIASGATFTENTNYEVPSAGSLNALKSALTTTEDLSVTWNAKASYNANTCKVTRQGKLVSISAQMSMGNQSIAAGEALISGLPLAADAVINGIYAISDTPNPKISVFYLLNGELCPREAIPSYSGGGYIYLYFVYTAAD